MARETEITVLEDRLLSSQSLSEQDRDGYRQELVRIVRTSFLAGEDELVVRPNPPGTNPTSLPLYRQRALAKIAEHYEKWNVTGISAEEVKLHKSRWQSAKTGLREREEKDAREEKITTVQDLLYRLAMWIN